MDPAPLTATPHIRVAEVMAASGRSWRTVMRALAGGGLEGIQPYRRHPWSFRAEEVTRWIEAGCPTRAADPDAASRAAS